MAKAVGSVFSEKPAIASSVNFTFLPMPDDVVGTEQVGAGCATADKADACVLYASGCVHGCTGKSALALGKFVSCYEGSFKEMMCLGAATKDAKCVSDAGIDQEKYKACRADASILKQVQEDVMVRMNRVFDHFFHLLVDDIHMVIILR